MPYYFRAGGLTKDHVTINPALVADLEEAQPQGTTVKEMNEDGTTQYQHVAADRDEVQAMVTCCRALNAKEARGDPRLTQEQLAEFASRYVPQRPREHARKIFWKPVDGRP
jgi:hypothetical protein